MPTKKPKQGKLTNAEIDNYINGIHSGKITEKDLPTNVYESISNRLFEGVQKGYGMQIEESYAQDLDLLNELRTNVFMFGAAKTYQQTKEISSLLIGDDGKIRDLRDFQKIARESYANWNDNWGETEYSTAIGQASAAQKWRTIEAQADVLPMLRYSAIGDACDICAPFNGMVAPVGDPIWNTCAPLNHFNCKCLLLQEDGSVTETPKDRRDDLEKNAFKLMNPVFRSNPGKDGMIFNESHPYFDVAKEDIDFAKNNFDLPLPEPVETKQVLKEYSEANDVMKKYGLPKERQEAIEAYTRHSYGEVNNFLRNDKLKEGIKPWEEQHIKEVSSGLSDFIQNAPKLEGKSYRGFRLAPDAFDKFYSEYREGAEVIDKGFLSSSVDADVAYDFMDLSAQQHLDGWQKVMIEIQGKNGVLIQDYAAYKDEKEVIFDKGTKFKVLSRIEKGRLTTLKIQEL